MYHSDIDVIFSYSFDEVCNRQIVASIYMLNDPRYIVADPRYTISALHLLPSHTFEFGIPTERISEKRITYSSRVTRAYPHPVQNKLQLSGPEVMDQS